MAAAPPEHVAVDLGAESGRVAGVTVADGRLTVTERGRFLNAPLPLPDRLAWNIGGLFDGVLAGIAATPVVASIGIDGWGVDFALLRRDGSLVAPPRAYRDPLTAGILPRLHERIPKERLFERTGIQMMEINTICQLLAARQAGLAELEQADRILLLPDLLMHWLGAEPVAERTNASTSQLLGLDGAWDAEALSVTGVAAQTMPTVVPAGTLVGTVSSRCGERSRHIAAPLVAVATHDTASAVVATPLEAADAAWISSGTWSIVGMELERPVVSPEALALNLSNEHGVDGTYRLLKNVMGLWLVQRCRATWAREDGRSLDYAELAELADSPAGFGPVIDPDSPELLRAEDVPAAIRVQCTRTGQTPPESRAAVLRCILQSLALRYRWTVEALGSVAGRPVRRLHIVGGGSRNAPLCRMTAAATGLPVIAGPAEASLIGNALVQAVATGHLASVPEGRALVRSSLRQVRYHPHRDERWEVAWERFCGLPGVGRPVAPVQV